MTAAPKLPNVLPEPQPERTLRLLSYNIQVGIGGSRLRDYFTHSWKHVLPHAQIYKNLDQIARLASAYDVVALQEVDAGSLRSGFVNQTEYLAHKALFPFWKHQVNRNLGHIAKHSNGLLSRFKPAEIMNIKLPGFIPGRRAMVVRFGDEKNPLILIAMHLSLGQRARHNQIDSICDIIGHYDHVVLMGDLNFQPGSTEMNYLLKKTKLCEPTHGLKTFPSWRPRKKIDHILVTPSLVVSDVHVLNYVFSDHLPIAMDIQIPDCIELP
ncbi:MAG: EEP domain-containing protein [Gammaproteobacteria bacterium]|nr:EEP domain-containing protein [Gammaproteobacteria bacterium]